MKSVDLVFESTRFLVVRRVVWRESIEVRAGWLSALRGRRVSLGRDERCKRTETESRRIDAVRN